MGLIPGVFGNKPFQNQIIEGKIVPFSVSACFGKNEKVEKLQKSPKNGGERDGGGMG